MTESSCYNYLSSVYVNSGDKDLLVRLKIHFSFPFAKRSLSSGSDFEAIVNNLRGYTDEEIITSLDKLTQVFKASELKTESSVKLQVCNDG